MKPAANELKASRRTALFLVVVMCTALLPLVAPAVSADGGRAASITVTGIPGSLEVNPGEAGEYTVRVRNTGSDPVTVQLSSSQEATEDCNGFSSSVTQIPGQIDGGSYEEAAMNVSVAQTVEADTACDTTITATITAVVGAPTAEIPEPSTDVVTTTAADGSGSALFGVDLTISESDRSVEWEGEEQIEYRIEVENTGQSNATVNLAVSQLSDSGCASESLTASLSETTVQLDAEDSEVVFATVEVPSGAAAKTYCWEVTGEVANDPAQEAKDTVDFELVIPELKECLVSLSKSSVSVNPGDDTKITATYSNDGNAEWTVYASAVGSKSSWVQVDGASSGLLPYDGGNGERAFDFIVSPDDSVDAGSETVVQIVGKDGNNGAVKCQVELRVIVGQSRGASISLATGLLSNIEPGSNKSTTITITNQGNGLDNLRVASSIAPTGWAVQLDASTVSVGSRHGNEKTATVGITVRVPANALAIEEIITFSVLPKSGGTAYDTIDLRVTVAAVHGLDIDTPATDQTGRSGTEVRFPIDLINEGNIRDTIGLSVVSQTASPAWGSSFENEDGTPIIDIDIEPQSTTTVYLVVSIDGEEELESSRLTVRVRNKDDPNSQDADGDGIPDNQREGQFLAVLSDRNFSMDLRLEGTDTATSASVVLPPNGQETIGMWVRNTGDGTDDAVFTLGGLEGIATRSITAFGLPVEGELTVPKGFGIWDIKNSTYLLQDDGQPYLAVDKDAAELKILQLELSFDDYRAQPYEVFVELTLSVNPGAQTGQGGVLDVLVTSVSNSADRSGLVSVSLEVSIIHEIEFTEAGVRQELDVVYGQPAASQEISILNTGNVRTEIRVFTSENLRGWSVILDSDNPTCLQENNDLVCDVDEGELLNVSVTVRAPYGAEMDDTYKFTVSAEPTETGVLDRQNIEFAAIGTAPEGVFGLSTTQVAQMAGVVLVLLLVGAVLSRRR